MARCMTKMHAILSDKLMTQPVLKEVFLISGTVCLELTPKLLRVWEGNLNCSL